MTTTTTRGSNHSPQSQIKLRAAVRQYSKQNVAYCARFLTLGRNSNCIQSDILAFNHPLTSCHDAADSFTLQFCGVL